MMKCNNSHFLKVSESASCPLSNQDTLTDTEKRRSVGRQKTFPCWQSENFYLNIIKRNLKALMFTFETDIRAIYKGEQNICLPIEYL